MSLAVVGVNHRTAPLDVRERFAHAPREVPVSLERVLAAGAAARARTDTSGGTATPCGICIAFRPGSSR